MALHLFKFHSHPDAVGATKIDGVKADQCVWLLDFSRPLQKTRWLLWYNKWVGITLHMLVPIVHFGEQKGGYAIDVMWGTPYFDDIQKLWRKHRGTKRTLAVAPPGNLNIIADLGKHFPDDCKPTR